MCNDSSRHHSHVKDILHGLFHLLRYPCSVKEQMILTDAKLARRAVCVFLYARPFYDTVVFPPSLYRASVPGSHLCPT